MNRSLALLLLLWVSPAGLAQEAVREKSLVAVAQDRAAIVDYRADPQRVERMIDVVICAVTGAAEPAAAWRSLVEPQDVVGIKVATSGGPFFSTHLEVVQAVVRGLRSAGVEKVIVWDRDRTSLLAAGYLQPKHDFEVRWIEPVTGYDAEQQFLSANLGKLIWGDVEFKHRPQTLREELYEEEQLSSASHLSRLLVNDFTKVINLPVLSDAHGVGVAGCIYNMTIPNVDNWRRFLQPPAYGDPYLAELYADPRVSGKVVLHLMDALAAQYAGGPKFDPNYALHFGAIYGSRDPVAVDATALRLIDDWRRQAQLPGVLNQAGYLESAARMGLGNLSPGLIEYRHASARDGDYH